MLDVGISSALCKDVSTSLDHLATCVPCQSGILALAIWMATQLFNYHPFGYVTGKWVSVTSSRAFKKTLQETPGSHYEKGEYLSLPLSVFKVTVFFLFFLNYRWLFTLLHLGVGYFGLGFFRILVWYYYYYYCKGSALKQNLVSGITVLLDFFMR